MKLRTALILICLGVAAMACFISIKSAPDKAYVTKPFIYGQEDVTRFLSKRGITVNSVFSLKRNEAGTELYAFLIPNQKGQNEVVKISADGIKVVSSPSQWAFIGANGDFVAWFSSDGRKRVDFTNGQSITLGPRAQFNIDRSGTYFVLSEYPESTWLGRVENPQNTMKIPKSFRGLTIFVKGKSIYVSGFAVSRSSSGSVAQVASLLVVEENAGGIAIISQHDFDWSFGVVDIDPYSDRVLLSTASDIFSKVYVYDLATGKRHRLGGSKNYDFFLTRDLLKSD